MLAEAVLPTFGGQCDQGRGYWGSARMRGPGTVRLLCPFRLRAAAEFLKYRIDSLAMPKGNNINVDPSLPSSSTESTIVVVVRTTDKQCSLSIHSDSGTRDYLFTTGLYYNLRSRVHLLYLYADRLDWIGLYGQRGLLAATNL